MKKHIAFAIFLSFILPIFGKAAGNLITTEGIVKAYIICLFPLLLVINPSWIRQYFEPDSGVSIGYIAYLIIFIQLVLF